MWCRLHRDRISPTCTPQAAVETSAPNHTTQRDDLFEEYDADSGSNNVHGGDDAHNGPNSVPLADDNDAAQEFAFLRAVAPEDGDEDAEWATGNTSNPAAAPHEPLTQSTPRAPLREPTKVRTSMLAQSAQMC